MKNMPDALSIDYAFLQKSPVIKKKTPALLVQRAPWTRAPEMLLQSLYFSRPSPPPRAIILDAHPLGTFENQDTCDGKTPYI